MKHYQQISIICNYTILIDYNIEIDYKFEDASNAYCKQFYSTYYIVFGIMDHKLYLQTLC